MQTCLCLPPWQWLLGLQLFKTHKMSALGAVWFERGSAFTLGFYSAFPKPCTPAPGLLLLKGKPSCCLILTPIRSQSRLLNTFLSRGRAGRRVYNNERPLSGGGLPSGAASPPQPAGGSRLHPRRLPVGLRAAPLPPWRAGAGTGPRGNPGNGAARPPPPWRSRRPGR